MKIGDKVVCVDDGPCQACGGVGGEIKGRVYVIEGIYPSVSKPHLTKLFLIGTKVKCRTSFNGEVGHNSKRFRLLDEMKKEAGERKTELYKKSHIEFIKQIKSIQ